MTRLCLNVGVFVKRFITYRVLSGSGMVDIANTERQPMISNISESKSGGPDLGGFKI